MPGWVWVVLVIFFLVMLVSGIIYAVRHAISALHVVAGTGDDITNALARLEQDPETREKQVPSFVLPIDVSAERYADAHSAVIRHQEEIRSRHAAIWKRWKTFNDLDR